MTNFEILKNILITKSIPHTFIPIKVNTLSVDEHIKAVGIKYKEGMSTLLFKTGQDQFFAILRRDDRNLNLKALKSIAKSKDIKFCSQEELAQLNIEVGLASPLILNSLQNKYKVKILIDKEVMQMTKIVCGSASSKYALQIQREDLLNNIENYEIVDITIPNLKRQDKQINIIDNKYNLKNMKQRILTGDRPTGYLHLGHYVGTIQNRVKLQDDYDTLLLIADVQGLTDNFNNPQKIRDNLFNVVKSNIAAGIDPNKVTFVIQSMIPQTAELTIFYANLISIQKLSHNPTVKTELAQKGMDESTPLGFFMYPVSQAADITIYDANLVPVGIDQAPMVEGTRELARKFNQIYGETIVIPEVLFGRSSNLPGIDGNEKMGKSLNNAIYLHESKEDLKKKVMSMKTDPNRIRITDSGTVEGNPVFIYHEEFNTNKEEVEDLKKRYREGKVGDIEVKEKLLVALENIIAPMREKMLELDQKPDYIREIVMTGTSYAKNIAEETMKRVRQAMKIDY